MRVFGRAGLVLALGTALLGGALLAPVGQAQAARPDQSVAKGKNWEVKPVAGGYQVTLIATPRRAVPAVELRLAGKTITFAATRAGQARRLTVTVPVAAGLGRDVVGTAVLARRSRAALLRVGAAAAPRLEPAPVIRTLPDGRRISEVR